MLHENVKDLKKRETRAYMGMGWEDSRAYK